MIDELCSLTMPLMLSYIKFTSVILVALFQGYHAKQFSVIIVRHDLLKLYQAGISSTISPIVISTAYR